jgi:drug/metabolite transporter (DMT)-like permease
MRIRRTVPVPVASTKARPRADLRANASAAMAAVLFGASVVAVRVAVRDVPPVSLAVLRMGQGSLLLAGVVLAVAPGLLRARWERLRLFALLGLVLFALFPLTFNFGLQHTEASRGAVMLATMPIWSALLGRIAGERLSGRQVAGVGLSVVGIGLAFVEPGRALGGDAMSLAGDGLLLLTGLLGALYGLIAKRVLAVDNPAAVTTYAMLFGTLALLPIAIAEGLVPAVAELDGQLLGLLVFLGVLGGAAAFYPVDVGVVPDHSHTGRGLREPEPDSGRPARDRAPGRTAQPHVRARLRGRGLRRAAGQLARRQPALSEGTEQGTC